jgi:glycosyltransferase involved in cell wall biosynthesis
LKVAHINLAKGFRGGERQTAILIEELSKIGISQTLFVRKDAELGEFVKSRVLDVEIIELSKPYFYSFKDFDLVHSHEAKANQLAGLSYLLFKTPYIVTRRVEFTPSDNFVNRYIYKKAKFVVALSKAIERDLKRLVDREIRIVPSAYSTEIRDSKDLILRRGKFVVGHVGALVHDHKGQCDIVEVARELEKSRPDIQFLLIGDGKDKEMCLWRSRYLTNIEFLGFKKNVFDYIKNFDIFIFPSLHEGLGSTLLDVMRLGKPIVASNVGGIPDIIENEKSGYLITPNSPQELKKRILELIRDVDKRESFVKEALNRVENFSPEKMRDRYLEMYEI